MKATIAKKEEACSDVHIFHLLPEKKFNFKAGQALSISLNDLAPRFYSVASQPTDSEIELHIKRAGEVSQLLIDEMHINDVIEIGGAIGKATYKKQCKKPIICIAGGTGISQIKSIVNAALTHNHLSEIFVYHAVQGDDLAYMNTAFEHLQKTNSNLKFKIISGDNKADLLRDVLERDFESLTGFRAYMSGPTPMIQTIAPVLIGKGIDEKRLHADNWPLQSA